MSATASSGKKTVVNKAADRSKVGFVSLGCPKNFVDTESMIQAVSSKNLIVTGNQEEADIVVVNTCGFLEPAKLESMETISEFVDRKKAGKLKAVIVAGCMTERYLEPMREAFPDVDAFIRTGEFSRLGEIAEALDKGQEALRLNLMGEVPQLKGHSEMTDYVKRMPGMRPFAYVKISEGCNRTCSFCIIPKLRGRHHSRSVSGIVDEIQQLVSQGVKEVVFIAQDLTSYGRDLPEKKGLLGLLQEVEQIEGLEWYRLMYNYPKFFSDELIAHLASSKKFSRYIDMPLQHSSDAVLKAMRRPESSQEIRELVAKLRSQIPGLFLRTTLMVGFPGETESDFEDLLSFVKEAEFDHLGAFTFFPEQGTPSAELANQIPQEVKEERYDRLMRLQQKIQEKKLEQLQTQDLEIRVDAFNGQTKLKFQYLGRHRGQAPEIDGVTYIESKLPLDIGSVVSGRVKKLVAPYDLLVEVA